MTVANLIEDLKKEDPNRIVICSADAEGNNYTPLAGFYTAAYKAETTWCGAVGMEKLTKEDVDRGYGEEDVMVDGVPCVVLKPTV